MQISNNLCEAVGTMGRVFLLCWWKSNSTMIKVFRITFILFYSVKLMHTSYQTNQLSRLNSSYKNFCCSTRGGQPPTLLKNKHEKIKFPTILKKKNNFSTNENYVDPNWISGFLDGEGCFHVSIYMKSLNKKY